MRNFDHAPKLAGELLGWTGNRWAHVRMVGRLADELVRSSSVAPEIAAAAWLHDIGYSADLAVTGFHPLDGAVYLSKIGVATEVVGLVAHHTGAVFEAEERGIADDLRRMPTPSPESLDALTLVDLVVAPDGSFTEPKARVAEILARYESSHPVHRAVMRSAPILLASAQRARLTLGLSDVWPWGVLEGVSEA